MTPDPTLIEQERYRVGTTDDGFAAVFDNDRDGDQFCLIDPDDCLGGLETAAARAKDIAAIFNKAQGSAALPSEAIDPHEIALSSLYWASNPSLVDATNRLREAGYNNAAGHLSNHMAGRFLDAHMAAKATLEAMRATTPTASDQDTGVPCGTGSRPAGRAASAGVSPVPASIPNAAKRWTRAEVDALGNDKWFLPIEYCPPRLVIIESPYAGDIGANVEYARAAMRDSLNRGEAPIASHLLYTQPGILRDDIPEERQWGIDAGLAWREVAELAAFYVDRGWSSGMLAARETYDHEGRPYEMRSLASAIEARRAATENTGAVHESAAPQEDAQNG